MKVQINKNSVYAPIRYQATRPYARRLGRAFFRAEKQGEEARLNVLRYELMPAIQGEMRQLGGQA